MTKSEIKEKIIEIRQHIHSCPELALQEYKTSEYIAKTMESFGFEVTRGIGKTGLVATLKCGDSDRMIGLRADMDALPIQENSNVSFKSKKEGVFHGCGHDSHVATLIGAALLLKESQDFNGTVVFVFQPGEEPGVGARAMLEDGLLKKFPIKEIYGQHNEVTPIGKISTRPGIYASSEDDFWITIKGFGGHASAPHKLKDPLVTAAELISALQTIVSRNINPLEAGTVTVCDIQTDGAMNITPSVVKLLGDCRTYNPAVQDIIEQRMTELVKHVCEMNGCEWEFKYDRVFVPMINDAECTQVVVDAATKLFGKEMVDANASIMSGSEDFSLYQTKVPGAFFRVGMLAEGATAYPLHNSNYVFNDDAIMIGSEVFAEIVRARLPKN